MNGIFGESGAGKSWITLAAVADVIDTGRHALVVDYEDSVYGLLPRLLALGIDPDRICEHVHYVNPSTAWDKRAQTIIDQLLDHHDIALAVIDSTGEAMASAGVKGNDDDDVARWMRSFPRWIATHPRAPAVLTVDHVPKADDAPPLYQIGSQRKRAAIDGASYRLDPIRAPSRDTDGLLRLTTAKDRNGHRPQGTVAAIVTITHRDAGRVLIELTRPDDMPRGADGAMRPTVLMERCSRWIETHPGASTRDIRYNVAGKASYVDLALRTLVDEGWVRVESGPRNASLHRSIRQYREDFETVTGLVDNPVDNWSGDAPDRDRVPPCPDRVPVRGDTVPTTVSRPAPPYGGGTRSTGPNDTDDAATVSPPKRDTVEPPFDASDPLAGTALDLTRPDPPEPA